MTKSKKRNFAKANFGTIFLTSGAKKAFIHLQKAFIKAPTLRHFDSKRNIWIETHALKYVINKVLNQMILDQSFSGHMTHKDPNFSKSKISQWHPIVFFSQKKILVET